VAKDGALVMGSHSRLPNPLFAPGLGIKSGIRSPAQPMPGWLPWWCATANAARWLGWQASSQGGGMPLRTAVFRQMIQLTGLGAI